jgi:predicted permease
MDGLLQDLRYGYRTLARSPGFVAIAVLTLALGIGANTAIFNVLDAVLLRALPVPHPQELTLLTNPDAHGHPFGSQGGERSLLAFWEFRYLHDHNNVFSGLFAADSVVAKTEIGVAEGAGERSQIANVRLVSGDYFPTLAVAPAAGRLFGPETDGLRGGAPVAVVSYSFSARLGPAAVGSKILIQGRPFEVVGVAPPGFFGETVGEAPDVWIPLSMQDTLYPGTDLLSTTPGFLDQHEWLQVMARRKPGVALRRAQANVNVVFRQMMESLAGPGLTAQQKRSLFDQHLVARPGVLGASTLRDTFSGPLKLLMTLVGLMLLIACANVANLLLARAASREKEFALRLAIGAGRGRSIRQLLTESFLLAIPGALAGFLLAQWMDAALLRMVSGIAGSQGAVPLDVHPDARMLLFTTLVAVLTTLLFGLAPALHLARLDLSEALRSTPGLATGGSLHSRFSVSRILVVAQVAASLVMLVATGLLVHSLAKLAEVNIGFRSENLLSFRVDPQAAGSKGGAAFRLHEQLLQKLAGVPGVRAVTLSGNGLFEQSEAGDPISIDGYTSSKGEPIGTRMDHAGPNYFTTVGIPILMGRDIGPEDTATSNRAAVINRTFARRYFPNANPLGRHVRDVYYPGKPEDMTIVGVVADAKYNSLREETPTRLYAPFFHPLWEHPAAYYEVRISGDPATVAAGVRAVVRQIAPLLPQVEIHQASVLIDESIGAERLIARLSGAFGLLAALLAGVGLYGVVAWTFARRTREIGIRMALGARPERVLRLVLRDTLRLVLLGVSIGIPISLAGTRLIRGMLFGLGTADPLVMTLAAILLTVVATLAGFLPARRAARVDPMIALRHE